MTQKIDKTINIIIGEKLYHIDVGYSAQCPFATPVSPQRNRLIMCELTKCKDYKFEYYCNPEKCPLDHDKKQSFSVDVENKLSEFYLSQLSKLDWNIDEEQTMHGEWGTKKILTNNQQSVPFFYHTDFEFAVKLMYFYTGIMNAMPMLEFVKKPEPIKKGRKK